MNIERYSRHYRSKTIGISGQKKLEHAKIAVVGAGGLGTIVLGYVVGGGCGNITLIENDVVDISNLHRQFFYKTTDCHKAKGALMVEYLKQLNPKVQITLYDKRVQDIENLHVLLKEQHLLVDATDNFESKIFLHDACFRARIPFITASVRDFYGIITSYKGYLKNMPCYHCVHKNYPKNSSPLPVVGMTPGVFGSLEAVEVFKEILNLDSLAGYMLTLDLLTYDMHKHKVNKNPQCSFCSDIT